METMGSLGVQTARFRPDSLSSEQGHVAPTDLQLTIFLPYTRVEVMGFRV